MYTESDDRGVLKCAGWPWEQVLKWYQYDETQEETSMRNSTKKKKKIVKMADQILREKLGPNFIKKKLSPVTNALACKILLVLTEKERWTLKRSLLTAGRALISQQGPWGVDLCRVEKLNTSC